MWGVLSGHFCQILTIFRKINSNIEKSIFLNAQNWAKMTRKHPPTCPKHILRLLGAHPQLFLQFFEIFGIFTIFTLKKVMFSRYFQNPVFRSESTKKWSNPHKIGWKPFLGARRTLLKIHCTPPGHILGPEGFLGLSRPMNSIGTTEKVDLGKFEGFS